MLRFRFQIYFLLFFFFIILFYSGRTSAQQINYPLFGKITDKETDAPLPYANIRKMGSSKGTISNIKGYFYIMLEPGKHEIIFSFLGYRSDTLSVEMENCEVQKNISLSEAILTTPEVVVSAYHLNPAERIIKKAIASKKKFSTGLHKYEFASYTKTVLTIHRTPDSLKSTDRDSNNSAISDSSGKEQKKSSKDTIVAGILESQIKGYWEEPDKYKEEITARRQTANFQASNNIITVGKIPNLNEDLITMENNLVVGPTSPDAFEYYSYEMIDTSAISNILVFRIKMTPKTENVPLFNGLICIADSSFSVIDIDITVNNAFNLPMLKKIRYRQQYDQFDNKYWLPVNIRMNFEIHYSVLPVPPIIVEQVSILHNYKINEISKDDVFDEYQVIVLPGADLPDSTAWANNKVLPLTDEELNTYHKMDSLIKNANFLQKSIFSLLRLMSEPTTLPITSFYDFYHYNRVEGSFLGIGFKSGKLLNETELTTKLGFGFSSKEWKYMLGLKQRLSEKGKTYLGFEIFRQLGSRDNFEIYDLSLNTFLCLINNFDYYNYYDIKGWRIFLEKKIANEVKGSIEYKNEEHLSLNRKISFGPMNSKKEFRENPKIDDGKFGITRVSLGYDNRKFINTGFMEIPAGGENTWNISLTTEYSNKDILKSRFEYFRNELSLFRHQITYASWSMDIIFRAGISGGILPFQKLFELPSSASGLSSFGVFRTLINKEFQGNNYAALFFEHNFGNYLFRTLKIPVLKDLGIDLILNTSAGWIDHTNKSPESQNPDLNSTRSIFYEAGFGIGNILPLMRMDFSWRLTHRIGNNFMFTVGSMVF